MALIVNNNPASIAAQRNLSVSTNQLGRSVERLSSGLRITRAADDAAGLGLSETLRAHIRSINQAVRNSSDGISLTQIADGAAATIGSLLAYVRQGDVAAVYSLRRGAAEVLELIAHGDRKSSKVVGRKIEEIDLPLGATIGAIVRNQEVVIAHHDTLIQAEDHVIVFVTDKKMVNKVERLFQVNLGFF